MSHPLYLKLSLERAQQLVLDTNYTIEPLARECRFTTPSYLISLFRKHVGMTPNAYRESFRQVTWERWGASIPVNPSRPLSNPR